MNESNGQESKVGWEVRQMTRQDLQGLFYRKLNYILMLEESQQAYQQREVLMISHRQPSSKTQSNIHPVTYLTKLMVRQNQHLRKQLQVRKKQAQAKVQLQKLQTNKQCLILEINQFKDKMKEMITDCYNSQQIMEAESNLTEHGKKYSLITPLVSFTSSLKQATTKKIIYDSLKTSLKKTNLCPKLQEINISLGEINTSQILEDMTAYLKQHKSSGIFKDLAPLLSHFAQLTTKMETTINNNLLYCKLKDQVNNNLNHLSTINHNIVQINNSLKDYQIQTELLIQQAANIKEDIGKLQEECCECITEEAQYLSQEYLQAKNECESNQINYRAHFNEILKKKYQEFIQHQLQDAEHIYLLKEKIQNQNKYIEALQQTARHSSISQGTSATPSSHLMSLKQINNKEVSIKQHQNKDRKHQGRQKFTVRKQWRIRSHNQKTFSNKQNNRSYEVKLTRKHLILQQATPNCLRVNEKLQIRCISEIKLEGERCVRFMCGTNALRLFFISDNIGQFMKELQFLNREKGPIRY